MSVTCDLGIVPKICQHCQSAEIDWFTLECEDEDDKYSIIRCGSCHKRLGEVHAGHFHYEVREK